MNGGPHKIHVRHCDDSEHPWQIRYGNKRLMAKKLLVFIQMIAHENGDWEGIGVIEDYGHDTLIFKLGEIEF